VELILDWFSQKSYNAKEAYDKLYFLGASDDF
jgi:hypothetical protein